MVIPSFAISGTAMEIRSSFTSNCNSVFLSPAHQWGGSIRSISFSRVRGSIVFFLSSLLLGEQAVSKRRHIARLFFIMLVNLFLYRNFLVLGYRHRFSIDKDIQLAAFHQRKFRPMLGNMDHQGMSPKVYLKGIGIPLLGNLWLKG